MFTKSGMLLLFPGLSLVIGIQAQGVTAGLFDIFTYYIKKQNDLSFYLKAKIC